MSKLNEITRLMREVERIDQEAASANKHRLAYVRPREAVQLEQQIAQIKHRSGLRRKTSLHTHKG